MSFWRMAARKLELARQAFDGPFFPDDGEA